MSAATLDVAVAHYDRGKGSGGEILPFHWAVIIRKNATDAYFYQVLGNMDTFTLSTATVEKNFTRHEAYRGAVRVGYVTEADLPAVAEMAAMVPIHRYRADWNCQNWVLALLGRMRGSGFVDSIAEASLRNQLLEQENHWQEGDSVYGEEA